MVFCDVDIQRARRLASLVEPNGIVLDDWRRLDFSALDALMVCTPPFARGTLEEAAIKAGLPVFVEKPIGLSSEQCIPVLRALDEEPTITAVGYMNRYRRSISDAINRLGTRRIIGIAAYWAAAPYDVPWWGNGNSSGGPLNDYATHLIDLARYFAGDVESVHASAKTVADSQERPAEVGVVGMRFQCNALGSLIYSSLSHAKSIAFDIIHEDGTLRLAGWDFRLDPEIHGKVVGSPNRDGVFFDETKAFLAAVCSRSTEPILSDFRDAFRTQQVVDAVRRALATGGVEKVG